MKKFSKLVRSVFLLLYMSYLLYLVFLSPYYGRGDFHRSYNLIPLKTILEYAFLSHNLKATLINIVGNILAFAPMGFLVPIVFPKYNNFKRISIIILIATSSIEIIQFIVGVGTCDIDDIILNWVGGIIGFKTYRLFLRSKK